MRTDLPWNVAGIPPEAREAARAAARREGLSIGEWLTRRILRSFADGPEELAPRRESWPQTAPPLRAFEEPAMTNPRDTQDMLARVSRSESETHNAYKKIEDQLRGMARRLESAERSQSENGRALNQAAAEINVASREQAQAFDQLGSHVIGLGERLDRLEHNKANEEIGDALKGLNEGLSRVADQVGETANQSAGQIAQLATTLEIVVDKMGEVQERGENSTTYLSQRIGLIDERVKAIETTTHVRSEAIERVVHRLEGHQAANNDAIEQAVADIEDRHAAIRDEVKQTIQSIDQRYSARREELDQAIKSVDSKHSARTDELLRALATIETRHAGNAVKIEEAHAAIADFEARHGSSPAVDEIRKAVADLEARYAAGSVRIGEVHQAVASLETRFSSSDSRIAAIRQAVADLEARFNAGMDDTSTAERQDEAIAKIGETVDRLTARNASNEVQIAGTLARLDGTVAKLEASVADNGLDRRVYGIERALADIVGRLESAERSSATASGNAEENFRTLGTKLDASDKRNRDAIAELRAVLNNTSSRLEVIEGVPHSSAPPAPPAPVMQAQAAPLPPAPPVQAEPPPPSSFAPAAAEPAGFDLPPFPEIDATPAPAEPERAMHDVFGAPPPYETDSSTLR